MGTSELGAGTSGGEEHTPAASSETPVAAEQPGPRAPRSQGPGETGRTSAGTLTRDEYGDSMRGQGPPVPPGDTPAHAPDTQEPRNAPAAESPGRGNTADAAEPRDRDTYAGEMRGGSDDPIPDTRDSAESWDAEPAGDPLETGAGTPDAEPRSRDGYAGAIGEDPPGDTRQLYVDAAADSAAPTWAGSGNGQASSETAAPEPPEGGPADAVPDTGAGLGTSPGPLGDSPAGWTAPDIPLPGQPAGYTGTPDSDLGRPAPDAGPGDGPGSLEDAPSIATEVLPGDPAGDSGSPGYPPPGRDAAPAAAQPPDQVTSPDTTTGDGRPADRGQDEMPGQAPTDAGNLAGPRADVAAAAAHPGHPQDIPPAGDLTGDSALTRGLADGQQAHSPPSPAPDRGTANANAGPETIRPPSDDAQPSTAGIAPGSDQPGRSSHDATGHPGPGGQAEPRADTSGQPRSPTQDGSDLTSATTGQGHFADTDAPGQHTEPREAPDPGAAPSELPAGQDTDQPPAAGAEPSSSELATDPGAAAGQDDTTGHAGHEKAYVEGREIEITHNRADGLWVSGLPGELPNAPYGDPFGTAKAGEVITSSEKNEAARTERLISKFCERADDILDITEKDLNEAQDLFSPRPTHTEIPVQVTHYTSVTPYHEIDAGSTATALMALGVAAWGVHHWWQQKRETSSGPEESADDSHR